EIPFDDHGRVLLPDRGTGGVERVEGRALVEQDRPLGVDVFAALVGPHGPASEGDDPAAPVLYRDDQAVAEPVEEAPVAPADQARSHNLVVGVALLPEVADQAVPAVRGVPQAELVDRLRQDAPFREVTGDLFTALRSPER